jgi:hypothetical protein
MCMTHCDGIHIDLNKYHWIYHVEIMIIGELPKNTSISLQHNNTTIKKAARTMKLQQLTCPNMLMYFSSDLFPAKKKEDAK